MSNVAAAPAASSSSPANPTTQNRSLPSRILIITALLLRLALYPLRLILTLLFPPNEFDGLSHTADKSAAHFSRTHFSSNGSSGDGEDSSPFTGTGYQTTLLDAQRQSKICLVYLHSPLHRDADQFLTLLKSPTVSRYLATTPRLTCYANSIHTADGANAAQSLAVNSYPFVAVLGMIESTTGGQQQQQQGRAEIILRMEGIGGMSSEEFLTRVRVGVESQEEVLREVERRRRIREEEIMLRQEQDREFQQTLLADQRREAERRRQEEEAQAAEQNLINQKQSRLQRAGELLQPEPAPGVGPVAKLRITLPSGKKVDRRFLASERLESVEAFLILYFEENDVAIENFSMSSTYPKRVYDDMSLSVEEAGLCPMAVIMVQDLDA
mmetsp:Transcript_16548/g.20599  ORF Transcript_16548/g.20599 Transcript_16548/m.20599 type:complete len:383 (-) Transcript_16548:115-1263(-)|eukprot:CAMPEP_0172499552 /NCGR_PEP_ID=MMETSP1066-20121228/128222_1 /TAXON_ID=671091 /ORGANISM="Coscinodiscus wailesii, Strain CCMP2513" /LENGTH=382 /DNA_ID=CAMNT_0013273337 /DNA_START=111 /DNA_END=1259 /DNA_ORIENTATION=-